MNSLLPRWGTRITAVLAVCSAGVGLAGLAQTPVAHADPPSSVALNGVGSDTLQDVTDAFAGFDAGNYYTPLSVGGSATALPTILNSWDAVPVAGATAPITSWCLTTQFGGPSFDRPNGSSEGATALNDAQGSTAFQSGTSGHQCAEQGGAAAPSITGQVQFSRSSRGPNGTSGPLTFIPFARDAVTVAVWDNNSNVLSGQLTKSLLASWYATPGTPATITISGTTYTVNLCLPQTGSGTRKFWFQALGISTDPGTTTGCASLEENGANTFQTVASTLFGGGTFNGVTGTANSISIMPFSVGSWISQINGKAVDRSSTGKTNHVYLDSLDVPDGGAQTAPTGTSGTNLVPNTTFYQSTTWGRNIYLVAPNTKVGAFGSATYKAMFVGATSQICSAAAQATANLFGFDSLTASEGTCGSTSQTGT